MKKLRSRAGFTLAETLIAVAILAIVTAAGTMVSGAVLDTRNDMLEVGDAQVLASTLLETLSDEIRYGKDVHFEDTDGDGTGDELRVDSALFGEDATFVVGVEADNPGYGGCVLAKSDALLDLTNPSDPTYNDIHNAMLIPEKAYTTLRVAELKFEQVTGSDAVTITLTINGRRGELWKDDLTVMPLNPRKMGTP